MFTGLIESLGVVRSFHQKGAYYALKIDADFSGELVIGQSVSVSGACLTVTAKDSRSFEVEMMRETWSRTWFGRGMRAGTPVNLERAMRLTDRLDGHLVLGHVDGVARLSEIRGTETKEAVFIPENRELLRGIVEKGSVAVDGVSLTVIDAGSESFSVGLIPATLEATTLGRLRAGSMINLETDILGKYVARLTGFAPEKKSGEYLVSLLSL
ncbi:MAG: riboflavin synthase [Synergistaceae bacterium]|nr:riboflavin synthase [Synergistaceae bacterium]